MRFATASVRPSLQRVVSRLTCSPTRRASVRVSVRHFDGEKGEEVCHFCSICSRRNTNATAHVRSERDSRRPRKTQVQSVCLPPEITHRPKPNVAVYLGVFLFCFLQNRYLTVFPVCWNSLVTLRSQSNSWEAAYQLFQLCRHMSLV